MSLEVRQSLCVAFVLGSVACEIEPDSKTTSPPETTETTSPFLSYRYLLLEDRASNPAGDHPGANIDSVGIIKGTGTESFLAQIHSSGFGDVPPTGANANFNNALGAPEVQCQGVAPVDWDPATFVSLGGEGGFLIASFASLPAIEAGDRLVVYVCASPVSEGWDLSVGTSGDLSDPNWFRLITGAVGLSEVTVPELPAVPTN